MFFPFVGKASRHLKANFARRKSSSLASVHGCNSRHLHQTQHIVTPQNTQTVFRTAKKIRCKRDSVIDCPFFVTYDRRRCLPFFINGRRRLPFSDSRRLLPFLLPITIGYCLFPCRLRFDRRGAVKADKPPARLRRVNFGALFARLMHHCRRLPTAAYAVQARQRTI